MPGPHSAALVSERPSIVRHLVISIETCRPMEFVDLTAPITAAVQGLGLHDGVVIIQTRHTTTGIMVNEHEPGLLEDLEMMFERLAPATLQYAHDNLARRTVNVEPGERANGHAHCRAALLRTSESVPVSGGALMLGRWQRVFLIEFDGGRQRQVSLTLMGTARA
jgi:secondary thiamine-phosphate synthase enzyme